MLNQYEGHSRINTLGNSRQEFLKRSQSTCRRTNADDGKGWHG